MYTDQEIHLQLRTVAPTPQETVSPWGHVAGKQGFPWWLGVEATGLRDTADLYWPLMVSWRLFRAQMIPFTSYYRSGR